MTNEMHLPTARYVLPSFIEQSAYGTKETNPYAKLFEERIIFLGTQVDDTSANDIMAQLLVLEGLDPDRDITMYINSPGGSFTSLMAIYDTMQYVRPDVRTVCLGQAASAAAVLLAAGPPANALPCRTPACSSTSPPPKAPEVKCPTWKFRPPKSNACAPLWRRPSPGTPDAVPNKLAKTQTGIKSSLPKKHWNME